MSEASIEKRASIWSHLNALRKCIIRVALVVGILSFFFFSFDIRISQVGGIGIPYPYPDIMSPISTRVFLQISSDLVPPDADLVALTPWAAVMVQFQISIMLALLIGMPLIVNEIGKFLGPALKTPEKLLVLRLTLPSAVLFFLGALFAYLFILPFSIDFLYTFAAAMGVEQLFTIDKFINFVLMMTMAFGVIAELPVIIVGLSSLGIVAPESWIRNWRWATLLSMIFAAIITPDGTGITMMMIAVPMMALYFSGCAVAISQSKTLTIGLMLALVGCFAVAAAWLYNLTMSDDGGDGFGEMPLKTWMLVVAGLIAYCMGIAIFTYSLVRQRMSKRIAR